MCARRALKIVRDDVDLSGVLFTEEELPKSWNPAVLFGNDAPIELEIGSGKGLFISNAAKNMPERNFLGIEIEKSYSRLCAARIIKQLAGTEQRNAVMFCADAAVVLRDYIPEGVLMGVHVYFPDPWWKRAHRKRRVLRTEVLKLIETRLCFGGTLHFWTDVEEYFDSTLELLKEHTDLLGPFEVAEKEAADDFDYRTHFERRTRLNREKVYRTELKRRGL
ncbi:MAG: tRNA (guanosine(46)-N7)-methyltransferase TrmB [Planctomycetaceae bacterium]|nr:tRNA (guanosine(46)-N7)-methyltransferase TrmB [Planctomycetaceae bacterium]